MLTIANNGQDVASTNYWNSEHARSGLCYLTANAGALRLLVPRAAAGMLEEMRTASSVTIENSISEPGKCVDIVFEDRTDAPFALALDLALVDGRLTPGVGVPCTVWTEHGRQLALLATIRTT